MDNQPQKHRLRLAVDIHSLKKNNFRGNIFFKFDHIHALNIQNFRSPKPTEVLQTHFNELMINNSFASFEFDADKEELLAKLKEQIFEIEVWHKGRVESDRKVGRTQIHLIELIKFPIKKTKLSYVRIYDAFHFIDQLNTKGEIVAKVGELRVILYLEDLGPLELLEDRDDEIVKNYKQFVKQELGEEKLEEAVVKDFEPEAFQQQLIMKEMMDLEGKVIWELENWKKAEEAKFKYNLKQREVDFLKEWQINRKERELERNKIFQEHESKLNGFNSKMQSKVNQLIRRENKLILLEEELKQRINEAGRQLAMRDDEVEGEKSKFIQSKKKLNKKIKEMERKSIAWEEKYKNIEEEFEMYRKNQERSPINVIREELSRKLMEVESLKRDLQKNEEVKNEYKKHFERLKNEILRMKQEKTQLMVRTSREKDEASNLLKKHLEMLVKVNEVDQMTNIRREFENLRKGNLDTPMINNRSMRTTSKVVVSQIARGKPNSNLERLELERKQFLLEGFQENDPLIQQIDQAISKLEGIN